MKRLSILASALILLMPSVTFAQDAQSNDLTSKVSAMDKIVSKLPSISGFVNTQYTFTDEGDGSNSFSIRRARLDFKGDLSKIVDYRLQLDFAGSPKIIDAFIKFKFSPYFNVQVGQFKVPFSLENPYAPLKLEAIDNAQAITKLAGFKDVSGEGATGRDLGLAITGGFLPQDGFNIIDYTLGVYNGNGINTSDNNKRKNVAGRLEIHPLKPITLAGSFYAGGMNNPLDASDIVPKNRYAISAQYSDGKVIARAEYLSGKTNQVVSEGYYALLGYWITPKLCPIVRYDYFRANVDVENNRSTYYMAGIDYWPWKFIRMQLNYTLKNIQAKDDMFNQVSMMVSVKF